MQASETKLQKIIEGTTQYLVPLFQRAYSWQKNEWQILWDDIIQLYNTTNPRPHFMGSIVTMPTPSQPEGISKYILIDGQQRLTTVFILLSALRDFAQQKNQQELAEEINNTLLVNTYKKDLDKYKLLPTQIDREKFYKIIDSKIDKTKSSILECYLFFYKKISQSRYELRNIKKVICNDFSVVSVLLGQDDDPYLVFESLNAKGRSLTQADLIRNYFFMRINPTEQEAIYRKYWQPMEYLLGENLTEFIRHYLTKSGVEVRKNDVYFEIKDRIKHKDIVEYLKDLFTFSRYYARLLNPDLEDNENIRNYLKRLNRLEVLTIYPFLLNCYDDWNNKQLTENDFITILQIIENFLLRRFVCSIPTNALTRVFALLYSQVSKESNLGSETFIRRLKLALQQQNYPKDTEFKDRLMDAKLYIRGRAERAKFILESIEEFFNHKEKIQLNKLSVEHIMPQTLNTWWREHLGEDWAITHELLLHSLGNLTLTGYNPELSNDSFDKKCVYFAHSHLELNKYFATQQVWRQENIEARAEYLADICLKIWSYFGDNSVVYTQSNNIKGMKPQSLTMFGEQYTVKSWRDVLEITLTKIAALDPDKFHEITEQFPRFVGWEERKFRSTRQLENEAFMELNLSGKDVYRFCQRALEIAEISGEDWQLEYIAIDR
jgi:uncharacterized protein with ParB-like and HNH nuclease domain